MKNEINAEETESSQVLEKIKSSVNSYRAKLVQCNRTAALWVQYMDMVDILRRFIKAERTANWPLHLHALDEMLPYLAASGHNLYVKCVHLYLESMIKLPQEQPQLYQEFMSGLHVVRRSDRYWAGLSTDLVIEQVLMRSLKTNGGLTRGRGMTDQQRLTWLLAMPTCAETNRAMQEFTASFTTQGNRIRT